MNERAFSDEDLWSGGSYDLAIELGRRDDARAIKALQALWSCPDLDGSYGTNRREPPDQPRLSVGTLPLESALYGLARVGRSAQVACRTALIRFDDEVDWLYFSLPLGSLANAFAIQGFPFSNGGDVSWRLDLDEWLCGLARVVFAAVRFNVALIGWDGGEPEDAERYHKLGVPEERWIGYLIAEADGLRWFPPNRGAPFSGVAT